jgi:hypothetical protein
VSALVLSAVQQMVLETLIDRGPLTARAAAYELAGRVAVSRVADALRELAKLGFVRDTGQRGEWQRNGSVIVWAAVQDDPA